MTNQPNPAQQASDAKDDGLAAFTEYFCRNYPGPDTIIGRPEWHAPKLFRAAKHAIEAARELTAAQGDGIPESFANQFADLNPATLFLVWNFATALADKLAQAEKKYGYSDGWRNADWMDECRAKLVEHVAKGDPRDVAAYCAFLWYHGEKTALSQPIEPQGAGVGAEMVERAEIAYRSAAVADGFADPSGDQITLHRRWMRHAIEAALPVAVGAGEDAKRLDFIERTFGGCSDQERYLPLRMLWGKGANGRTLREACDKYMARDIAAAPRDGDNIKHNEEKLDASSKSSDVLRIQRRCR